MSVYVEGEVFCMLAGGAGEVDSAEDDAYVGRSDVVGVS